MKRDASNRDSSINRKLYGKRSRRNNDSILVAILVTYRRDIADINSFDLPIPPPPLPVTGRNRIRDDRSFAFATAAPLSGGGRGTVRTARWTATIRDEPIPAAPFHRYVERV